MRAKRSSSRTKREVRAFKEERVACWRRQRRAGKQGSRSESRATAEATGGEEAANTAASTQHLMHSISLSRSSLVGLFG